MENTIQICCITVDFEPLPAADELQKERNLLGLPVCVDEGRDRKGKREKCCPMREILRVVYFSQSVLPYLV